MHHTWLQLVAALAQVVATQAAQHKVTRHAVARELTDSLAAAASTANVVELPAAVATAAYRDVAARPPRVRPRAGEDLLALRLRRLDDDAARLAVDACRRPGRRDD